MRARPGTHGPGHKAGRLRARRKGCLSEPGSAPPLPHFTEDALALHLLLEHPERLIDVVVANKYLQRTCPLVRGANGSKGLSGINRCLWKVAGLDCVVPRDRSTAENPSLRPATPIRLFPDGP